MRKSDPNTLSVSVMTTTPRSPSCALSNSNTQPTANLQRPLQAKLGLYHHRLPLRFHLLDRFRPCYQRLLGCSQPRGAFGFVITFQSHHCIVPSFAVPLSPIRRASSTSQAIITLIPYQYHVVNHADTPCRNNGKTFDTSTLSNQMMHKGV